LSDIVVAATGRFGEGRVVVFGDTSPFQNGALARSYKFVDRTLRWAAWNSPLSRVWDNRLWIAAALTIFVLLIIRGRGGRGMIFLLGFLPVVSLVTVSITKFWAKNPPVSAAVGWLDTTHWNRFESTGWENDSLGGLQHNIFRGGFLPLTLWDYEDLAQGPPGLLVIQRPTRSLGSGEIDRLEGFVKRGGKVIFAAGWEDEKVATPVLERFGIQLSPTPLGPSQGSGPLGEPKFYRANPTSSTSEADTLEVLAEIAGYPVVVSRQVGEGRFVHIADSCFLYNKNLEGQEEFVVEENVEFLKQLFATLRSGS
jgi:hypothetical protein